MTKPATIRQADIARAVRAALSAGMTELRIVLSSSGVEITASKADKDADPFDLVDMRR